ncbi:RsmF rRNA methyltransferase first C-terminal domain-containing protein [Tumebacillus algifaecis]|uniref:RsmF rRNA methyltransferase first C-terminal domain-containing protein n=1 Tax=Tumebacillus algifaecis TaxID=1214604 RepID=UPI001D130F31|nr:RsmB/NOP family class I SAM-dependent RNA methyltransferase [Tumebacillus algifaecis]
MAEERTYYPEAFLTRMQELLGAEYAPFHDALTQPAVQGLRVNTLKTNPERFLEIAPFHLTAVPWVADGFYYEAPDRPGKHPYHAAGVYYIQEPSAMSAAEVLQPKRGDRVLDLCAAPGGKSTHLAALLQGTGLLVANEPHPQRAKILSENIERCGVTNALVTNEMPDRLAERFPAFFDKILVDAPCSGEGMFRKDPDACEEWSPGHVTACAVRQLDILDVASQMLRAGGTLVYSTCTFAPAENEGLIESFLQKYPVFELVEIHTFDHFSPGQPQWAAGGRPELAKTARLWPHRLRGEGHFVAHLRKTDGEPARRQKESKPIKLPAEALKSYQQFAEQALRNMPSGEFLLFGDNLYLVPSGLPDLKGLKVVRPGWHLGTLKKNRFEPSHALALGLRVDHIQHTVPLTAAHPDVVHYLRGETLNAESAKGWVVVTVDGFPLGWGKQASGMIKNHYPKGLRWP